MTKHEADGQTPPEINGQPSEAYGGSAPVEGYSEGALLMTVAKGLRQTFSSLSNNRPFLFLFTGNVGFFFGMNMMMLLRSWLVIDKWDNAALLGYLLLTMAGPMLFLSPIAGVVTDRVDKRKLLIAAQSILVVSNIIIMVLILTDMIQFWHLMIASSVSGTSIAFNMPGRQAMVAMLVPREKLMNAMALSTAMMNASRIVAPTIAGVLIAPIGIGGAYVVSTAFYAFAVAVTFGLPSMPSKREREFTFFEDFVGGFSYIRHTPLLLGLLLFATIPMLFAMPYMMLMPVFADRVWHVGSSGLGVMQAAGGVGGLIGALIVANLDAYPKKGRLLLAGALGFGGSLILFAVAPFYGVALVLLGAVGFGSMIVMTVNNTSIQLIIPDEIRGRVMSVMMMTWGLMPLGGVPAGIAAEAFGARPVVVVGGMLSIVAVLMIFSFFPAFRTLDRQIQEGRARETARRATGWEAGPTTGTAMPGSLGPERPLP